MRKLTFIILFLCSVLALSAQIVDQTQNKALLASTFYRNNEFDKAAPLYLELYESSNTTYYFEYYINCLVGMKDYDNAEKALKKQLKKNKDPNYDIMLGYIAKEKGDMEKARSIYDDVLKNMKPNLGSVVSIANNFFNRREYEYAEKTYMRGREIVPGEMFRTNLATIYAYSRNYSRMMEEYLLLLKENEKNLASVEGRFNSLLRYDFDNTLSKLIKKEVLKKVNEEPDVTVYNRLLIWFFTYEENYEMALTHAIALDKRTKQEETDIFNFSQSAALNNLFDVALKGLNYLKTRTPVVNNIDDVKKGVVSIEYQKYINTPAEEQTDAGLLVTQFDQLLDELGYTANNSEFIIDYAHFQAFYLNENEKAYSLLEKGLAISNLTNMQRSGLKLELADLNVLDGNLWGAALLYAQVVDSNKDNPIGDDAKLKKARLAFYLGDINWAKAQLDVLKASTSKLIANDAMELSLLISAYYELDTVELPIQIFARGDLCLFQNNDKKAIETYDSITTLYPGHSLKDKILMRKAMISEKEFHYEEAVNNYQSLLADYAYSTSADDALYRMAVILEEKLGQKEKAQELYKQLLVTYPSSIFTADSRYRFRKLRGDKIEGDEVPPDFEDQLMRPE